MFHLGMVVLSWAQTGDLSVIRNVLRDSGSRTVFLN